MSVDDSQDAQAAAPVNARTGKPGSTSGPGPIKRKRIEPRMIAVGGAVALVGVAVLAAFLWMVPNAAAREMQAACRGLRPEPELKPQLCANGAVCASPVPAPDFTAQDITGHEVKLSSLRGKVVLLNFWASWCGVCKTEKPRLNQMAAEMASRDDFVVVALASDHSWPEALTGVLDALAPDAVPPGPPTMEKVSAAFRQALPNGAPFKVWLDRPSGDENIGKIAASWGITAVPESALIDRQGNIRAYFGNKRDWQSPVAETCLRSIIDGP